MSENEYYIALVNQANAQGIVHSDIPGTDLAAIAKIRTESGYGKPVTESDLQDAYMTDEEVMEMAHKANRETHYSAVPMEQMLGIDMENAGIDAEQAADMTSPYTGVRLYVLTNENGVDGAAALMRPDIMKDITDKFGPVYVLPSSIHEVIILPKSEVPETEVDSLQAMVYEINRSELRPDERLSDNVFQHDGHNLSVASSQQEVKAQDMSMTEERSFS